MAGRGGGKNVVFASHILSPYFAEYTNDEPLKTNFRFIDTNLPPSKKIPKQNETTKKQKTKIKSHLGAVSPQRPILQLLTQSVGFETIILLTLKIFQ